MSISCFSHQRANKRSMSALGTLLTARNYYQTYDFNKALTLVRLVVQKNPDNLYARNFESEILYRLYLLHHKDAYLNQAFQTLYAALSRGRYYRTFYNLARYYLFRNKNKAALHMYKSGFLLKNDQKILHKYLTLAIKLNDNNAKNWAMYQVLEHNYSYEPLLYLSAMQFLKSNQLPVCLFLLNQCIVNGNDRSIYIKSLHAKFRILKYECRYKESQQILHLLISFLGRGRDAFYLEKIILQMLCCNSLEKDVKIKRIKNAYFHSRILKKAICLYAIGRKSKAAKLFAQESDDVIAQAGYLLTSRYNQMFDAMTIALLKRLLTKGSKQILYKWTFFLLPHFESFSLTAKSLLITSLVKIGYYALADRYYMRVSPKVRASERLYLSTLHFCYYSGKDVQYDMMLKPARLSNFSRNFLRGIAYQLLDMNQPLRGLSIIEYCISRFGIDDQLYLDKASLLCCAKRFSDVVDLLMKRQSLLKLDYHWNMFAYSLAKSGKRLELAKYIILKLIKKYPFKSSYLDTLGYILLQSGLHKKAKKWFSIALKLTTEESPGRCIIMEHLGDTSLRAFDKERALHWYRQARDISSDKLYYSKKIHNLLKQDIK